MKKTRRFLSAALAAAVFGTASAYVAFADAPSKEPTNKYGLALVEKGENVYGVTMTVDQIRALKFSPADNTIGRTEDGYYAGFYVEAFDTNSREEAAVTYTRRFGWETIGEGGITAEQIKELTYSPSTGAADGQLWIGLKKEWLSVREDGRDHFVYAIKTNYGGDTDYYYYIDVNLNDIPEDFKFETECNKQHTPLPCNICGNAADVTYTSVNTAFPGTFTGEKKTAAELITDHIDSVIIKDNEVVVTFDDTYANIKKIMDGDDLLKKSAGNGGVDPIYLNIATNIPDSATADDDFNWVAGGGYGWDSAVHSDNFNAGHIMLWLNPSNSAKTIKFTVGGGEEQTLKINYKYKSSTTGGSGSTTKPSTAANATNTNPTKNPATGITLAAAPAILAAGAVIVAAKKRK